MYQSKNVWDRQKVDEEQLLIAASHATSFETYAMERTGKHFRAKPSVVEQDSSATAHFRHWCGKASTQGLILCLIRQWAREFRSLAKHSHLYLRGDDDPYSLVLTFVWPHRVKVGGYIRDEVKKGLARV